MSQILDVSPDGSRITYREEDGKTVLKYLPPDVSAVERSCDHLRALAPGKFERKKDFHHVARVPSSVLTEICNRTGLDFFNPDDADKIGQIIKRDYAKFRIA